MANGTLVPAAILTGFLGAGKTTLLNRILSNPGEGSKKKKFAVIINELGRIGIDPRLVTYAKDDVLELSNGCVCCTVRLDLAKTIYKILRRGDVDYLLIETTGIAEPAPIVQTFQNIPEIRKISQIDAIITVVDAENILAQMGELETARNQVILADFIILNKLDLITAEARSTIESALRELNPMTQILPATNADVDWRLFLDTSAFDVSQKLAVDTSLLDELRKREHAEIQSFSFHYDRPFDLDKLEACIARFSKELRIYRSKGIVHLAGEMRRAIFHGVNNRFTIAWGPAWGLREQRGSDLVFIGKNLSETQLKAPLDLCLAG